MRTQATQTAALLGCFAQHGGYLTSRQVRAAGLSLKPVQRLIDRGEVEAVQRGVYRLTAADLPPHADLIELQLRVPYARPALITALDLHGLTTTRPTVIQVAIPVNAVFPRLAFPPVEVFWYPPGVYDHGVIRWTSSEPGFETYSAEKTIADLLRLERRLGQDVYLEGLKNYLARPDRDLHALLTAAQGNGVDRQPRRDLEVLTHEANR